ncbi:helix-turn-helix transcriptional regulator [Pseudonocardia xinjiangensis]|uniref:helix-turn-helix transcriptional regulator n=1 Tax=Pseudonocardia xinjiangensis TaxID=75289 RepID=UPI003D90C9CC
MFLVLLGRQRECEVLDRLLEAVRAGESRALVVRGEPGVGKTALLQYLVGQASGCRMAYATGIESEMELAFAGLHQLCMPVLDRLEHLPQPRRDALTTAFGISAGDPPDRFLVGLAVLELLSGVAEERPLICVVDDAQWLDRASVQALAFVARRLMAESVSVIFAARTGEATELTDLAQLVITGLPDEDARKLLCSTLHWPLDDRVRDRLIAETKGNPLALLELPRGLTPAELSGGVPGPHPLPQPIESSFQRQMARLPSETRRLLLVAAAEPLGDGALMFRASEQLGIGADAAGPAAEAGLLKIGAQVWFRHPSVRSAVYRAASRQERRSAHRALADATDPEADFGRRAWHAAHATARQDENIPADLEHAAGRARARGDLAAGAAFLGRAAELTVDPNRRAQRALAAAQATHLAGAHDAALTLLCLAEACPLTELQRAKLNLQRARIAFSLNRGREAPPLLLQAARQLEQLDVELAGQTYLEALSATMFAGALADGDSVREVAQAAQAARAASPTSRHPRAPDLLVNGLAVRFTDGYAAGAPVLQRALHAFRDHHLSPHEGLRWLWHACITAAHLWDYDTWELLATRFVRAARETGALTMLPLALSQRIGVHVFLGQLTEAVSLREELNSVTDVTGDPPPPIAVLLLAAWQGREAEARELIKGTTAEVLRRGEGDGLVKAQWAAAILDNSRCRYEDALAAAEEAADQPPVLGVAPWAALAELVEAATRCGTPERAADAFQRLTEITRASGTDWALGIQARSRALLSCGENAESAYCEAIDRLGRTRVRGELARAHLLYGEWLRREGRRVDARQHLRAAHDIFAAIGAKAFGRRAAAELRATGESARKRCIATTIDLTPQEAQVVSLVREGLSNAEIGARLFVSPRTVEWHMGRIFAKLDITSRRQLHLGEPPRPRRSARSVPGDDGAPFESPE